MVRQAAGDGAAGALSVRDLGLLDYAAALALQETLVEARLRGDVPDTLLLLEHPPVVTLGRRGSREDVYATDDDLAARGIGLVRSTRGGLVTYHGPGQLVGYPILRLPGLGRGVAAYVRGLERTLVGVLADLGIAAWADPSTVGVWTAGGKIGAIGVAVRHGVSLHGFALNVAPDLGHFGLINPCGLGHLGVTSIAALLGRAPDMAEVKARVASALAVELGYAGVRWLEGASDPAPLLKSK